MARGVNKVILVGNLGQNLKYAIPKQIQQSQHSQLRPQNHGKIKNQVSREKKQSGTG